MGDAPKQNTKVVLKHWKTIERIFQPLLEYLQNSLPLQPLDQKEREIWDYIGDYYQVVFSKGKLDDEQAGLSDYLKKHAPKDIIEEMPQTWCFSKKWNALRWAVMARYRESLKKARLVQHSYLTNMKNYQFMYFANYIFFFVTLIYFEFYQGELRLPDEFESANALYDAIGEALMFFHTYLSLATTKSEVEPLSQSESEEIICKFGELEI